MHIQHLKKNQTSDTKRLFSKSYCYHNLTFESYCNITKQRNHHAKNQLKLSALGRVIMGTPLLANPKESIPKLYVTCK